MSILKYYFIHEDASEKAYDELRNAGKNDQSLNLAIENMKRYFPEISEEDVRLLLEENYIIREILKLVCDVFIKWYDWDPGEILINHNNQNSINSYAVTAEEFPMFIHIDQLLESVTFSFMLIMLKWAKAVENNEQKQNYFSDLLYILNEMALMGQLPAESGKDAIIGQIVSDRQIQTLASDCHWAMIVFTIGHEMAHIYQMSTRPDYWGTKVKEAERNADAIGYDILLKLIMYPTESDVIMEEYAYLAPMMYMDLFQLVFFTDNILYGKNYVLDIHGTPEARKQNLFDLVDQEQYQFDTTLGNAIYQSFLDSYDRYCMLLSEYLKAGKLDTIIHREQRNERETL